MSDLAATLWKEFAVETEEHLDTLERLLVGAELGAATAEDIGQLFRSFHTIKGLSRSMDVRGMEQVTHASENLLGLVRDGVVPLSCDLVPLLLESVDALKDMRAAAAETQGDAPAREELLARLEVAFVGRNPVNCCAAAPVPPKPEPAPAEPVPAPVAEPLALDADPEMVAIFTELLAESFPILARAAMPDIEEEAVRQDVVDTLDALRNGAEVLGFDHIVRDIDDLRGLLDAVGALDGEQQRRILVLLGNLRKSLTPLEEEQGADAPPARALDQHLRQGLLDQIAPCFADLSGTLQRFEAGDEAADSDAALAEDVASLARVLNTFFLFLDFRYLGRLLLMIEDIFSRVAAGEIFLNGDLLRETRHAMTLIQTECLGRECATDVAEHAAEELLARFRSCLLAGTESANGSDPMAAVRRVLSCYDIKLELVEILSPENIQELLSAARGGKSHIYEILADLESSPDFTRAMVAWLQKATHPITNRTIFAGKTTWFEFLVVSELAQDEMQRQVTAIDERGDRVKVVVCHPRPDMPATPAAEYRGASVASASGEPARPSGRAGTAAAAPHGTNVLRIPGEVVDQFIACIGEMVTIGNSLDIAANDDAAQSALQELMRHGGAGDHHVEALERAFQRFRHANQQLHSVLSRLQESALGLRVVPVNTVFSRFPRVVRDLAQAHRKQVRLDLEDGDVRIDKGMVEVLAEPLMHMVRNAIDHGIEPPADRQAAGKPATARILLRANQRGNRVEIVVQDDGRGLDRERIRAKAVEKGLVGEAESRRLPDGQVYRFIFAAGFSTAETITETSGRGVGMDVVVNTITRLGGTIDIQTEKGAGTTFTFHLPLSAAIQTALMVEVNRQMLAIPERYLAEIHEAGLGDFQSVNGQRAILLRNSFLPVFALSDLLGRPRQEPRAGGACPIVVLVNDDQRIGIEVDRLHRRQELFLKEIHPRLAAIPGVGGASIMGDGSVVLIVDGDDLFRIAAASGRMVPAASATLH